MEYMLLNLNDYNYTEDVEEELNKLASIGWRVIAVCGFGIILGKSNDR
jgi:hypothetical protein